MIIACENCNKKFDIDGKLIPEKGRLLQCNSCNHKWFFKNEIAVKIIEPKIDESLEIFEIKKPDVTKPIDFNNRTTVDTKINPSLEEITNEAKINKTKIHKKNNLLNLIIVFIITFIAIIILLDTFKHPLGTIVPNIEFLLYNLYESIKDIILFISDLIKTYD